MFEGQFNKGNFDEGVLALDNGEKYTGKFKDKRFEGHARMNYDANCYYEGDTVNRLR